MLKGINLTLLMGPTVPVPVPPQVLEALQEIQVTITAGQASGFQLSFTLSSRSPWQTMFMIAGSQPIPLVRVIIVVTVNGTPEVLMDGVITNHELAPGNGTGQSTLTITGEDLSRLMDFVDFSGTPYPALPAEARVVRILAKYATYGIVPAVVPGVLFDVPLPTERIPVHQGTDLDYLKQLANEAGYVFYLEPGPGPGLNTGYWGPEIKVGLPQPALNVDMDAHTNVEAVSFSYDPEVKTQPLVYIQNQATKVPLEIPVPDISPLNPPLGLVAPAPKKTEPLAGTAKLSPGQAVMLGLARAAATADVVSVSGRLDVLRYGRLLKARRLVGLRGAGLSFDGFYYVKSVTHQIKGGEYKELFTLSRNGLISTIPEVPA